MRAFIAFTHKEFTESIRTYKLLIVFAVFLLFGMLNPITAKVMPDIFASVMPTGMEITIPTPSALDAWTQFYKNMAGLQMIVFVIVFSGLVASELSKGTLVNMLTKGLKRKTVILSKFTATTTIWTIAYAICFGVTYGYTLFLLPGELPNILFAALGMWLFGILMITVMLLGGVLFANLYGALLVTGGFAALLMLLHIIPSLQSYNPYKLASENLALLTGSVNTTSFYMAMFVTVLLSGLFLWLSVTLFNKKQL